MKVLIIEDERLLARKLGRMLQAISPDSEIIGILGSVGEVRDYFSSYDNEVDLIISDIRLGDGVVFDALDTLDLQSHVVFVTAYDEYAIRAFKYNGIDYILKPPTESELEKALQRAKSLTTSTLTQTLSGLQTFKADSYRRRIICETGGGELHKVDVREVAYFYLDYGVVRLHTFSNKEMVISDSLDRLEEELDPHMFFRANRQYIVNSDAIEKVVNLWCRKYDVKLRSDILTKEPIRVSREKMTRFKNWLNS